MRIFKNTTFSRFARKHSLSDAALKNAVTQLEQGHFDADLGGGVYKQRIAREGAGKSGGYRLVIFFKTGELTFFVYGFAKSDQANISRTEMKAFKETAKQMLTFNDKELALRLAKKKLEEIS
jgi:hypothetical protein